MPIPSRPISLRATSPLTSPIWHGLVILPISPPMRAGSIAPLSKIFAQSKSSVTLFLTALIPASHLMPSIWLSGVVSLTPVSSSTPTVASNTPPTLPSASARPSFPPEYVPQGRPLRQLRCRKLLQLFQMRVCPSAPFLRQKTCYDGCIRLHRSFLQSCAPAFCYWQASSGRLRNFLIRAFHA